MAKSDVYGNSPAQSTWWISVQTGSSQPMQERWYSPSNGPQDEIFGYRRARELISESCQCVPRSCRSCWTASDFCQSPGCPRQRDDGWFVRTQEEQAALYRPKRTTTTWIHGGKWRCSQQQQRWRHWDHSPLTPQNLHRTIMYSPSLTPLLATIWNLLEWTQNDHVSSFKQKCGYNVSTTILDFLFNCRYLLNSEFVLQFQILLRF